MALDNDQSPPFLPNSRAEADSGGSATSGSGKYWEMLTSDRGGGCGGGGQSACVETPASDFWRSPHDSLNAANDDCDRRAPAPPLLSLLHLPVP